ncbi:MAG TPA: DUF4384 domain-containing protein, partial [Thermodesulfobacteriota bacterium]|nr:DUF4384 domain-containing protein [Thermodesulfobacteriota bacterium]
MTLLLFVSQAHASETPVPDKSIQGQVWITAEGEAYLGEIETQKEVKDRAKIDAQNKAVEQAVGTFIRAHTLVSNNQVAEDLIYAAVRGKIDKVEIIKQGWDEKDRSIYRVKLKALIKPVYPEKGEGISIKLFLSKTDLRDGEEVKIFYQTSSDCYIYIFSVAADGSVTLLLPNSVNQDNSVKAGKSYYFPFDEKIKLQAQFLPEYKEKTAEEKIKIIATRQKEDIIPLGFQQGFFKVYDAKSTGMISDLVKRLNQLEPADWSEATAVYTLKR